MTGKRLAQDSIVRLDLPGLAIAEPVSRSDLIGTIGPQVRAAQVCARDTVASAGLRTDQVELVVTTGGSSLIPAFRQMLAETFPRARIETSDPLTSVAAGLARVGFGGPR